MRGALRKFISGDIASLRVVTPLMVLEPPCRGEDPETRGWRPDVAGPWVVGRL